MGVEAVLPTCAPGVDQQCDKHEMTVTAVAVGTNPFASWPVLFVWVWLLDECPDW